jgi:hypothetical protein
MGAHPHTGKTLSTTQPQVNTCSSTGQRWQRLSLHRCQCIMPQRSNGLRHPRTPSAHSASHGLRLSWRNQPTAALLTHTGELVTRPQQPALQPGNQCALNICQHSVSAPWCKRAPSWPHQLQLHSISVRPFLGPHAFTRESPNERFCVYFLNENILHRSWFLTCGQTDGYNAHMRFFKCIITNLPVEGTDSHCEKLWLIITMVWCDIMNGRHSPTSWE